METEIEWLSNHMGHTVGIHKSNYRLHESTLEMARVSGILLAIDSIHVEKSMNKSFMGEERVLLQTKLRHLGNFKNNVKVLKGGEGDIIPFRQSSSKHPLRNAALHLLLWIAE